MSIELLTMKRKKRKKNPSLLHLQKVGRVHVTTPAVYPVLLKAAAVGALSPSLNLQTPAFARETAALHPGRNPVFKAQMFIATFPFITTTVRQMGGKVWAIWALIWAVNSEVDRTVWTHLYPGDMLQGLVEDPFGFIHHALWELQQCYIHTV